MKLLKIAIALSCLGLASTASAESSDLLVGAQRSGQGTMLSFDFVNDGGVTSMQFDVDLGTSVKKAQLGKCISGMPKATHAGGCNIVNGMLRVLVFSPTNKAIPSGTIGTVYLPGDFRNMKSTIVDGLKLAAPDGVKPAGEAFFDAGPGVFEGPQTLDK